MRQTIRQPGGASENRFHLRAASAAGSCWSMRPDTVWGTACKPIRKRFAQRPYRLTVSQNETRVVSEDGEIANI
jgi:hypothetical protein